MRSCLNASPIYAEVLNSKVYLLKEKAQFFKLGSTALLRAEITFALSMLPCFSSTKEKDPRPALATSLTKYLLHPNPTPKLWTRPSSALLFAS